MSTLLEDIKLVLQQRQGVASLSDICADLDELRSPPHHQSFDAIIRRELESHSSDSEAFTGGQDLFFSVEGTGAGVWGLRGAIFDTTGAVDVRDVPAGVGAGTVRGCPSTSEAPPELALKPSDRGRLRDGLSRRLTLRDRSLISLAVLALLVLVFTAILAPHWVHYNLQSDDFPLVLNSAHQTTGVSEMVGWFTKGYSDYFDNYPNWSTGKTPLARPVENFAFYIMSFAAEPLGDRVYVLLNCALVLGCAYLMMMLIAQVPGVMRGMIAASGLAVGFSPVFYPALLFGAFGTNAFATLFSIASLVVLRPFEDSGPDRLLWAGLLQALAVASHETSIIITPISICLLFAFRSKRPTLSSLLPLGLPVLYLLVIRTAVGMADSTNLRNLLSAGWHNVRWYLPRAVLPYDFWRFAGLHREINALEWLPYVLAGVLNVALIGAIGLSIFKGRSSRLGFMTAGLALASLGALIAPQESPRYSGILLVMSILVCVVLASDRQRAFRWILALIVVVNSAFLVSELYSSIPGAVNRSERARRLETYLRASITSSDADTVVLLNDDIGGWGARSMVSYAAQPRVLDVVILNNLYSTQGAFDDVLVDLYTRPRAVDAQLDIDITSKTLTVRNVAGQGQRIRFDNAAVDFRRSNQGFLYETVAGSVVQGSFVATKYIAGQSLLLVGTDLSDGALIEPLDIPARLQK